VLADISMNYINHNHNSMKPVGAEESDEMSVVQYMSAACRASRSKELRYLPAAWLLRQVNIKQHHPT
jgi:hypothetical protein